MGKSYGTSKRFDIEDTDYDAELLRDVTTGKLHWHSHFLLSLFKRGHGVQMLNHTPYPFSPGTVILMGPFDFHYNTIEEGETFDVYSIKFSHPFFDEELCKICHLENFPLVGTLAPEEFRLAELLCDTLIAEKNKDVQPGHALLVKNIIQQLVILVTRNAANGTSPGIQNPNIRKALLYIHDNFRQPLSHETVARVCHYTPNYFSSCFRKETGVTFQRYLLQLRLTFAHNLIRYGEKSCTEACFEAGFHSMEYFSAAFKKEYGHSPKYFKEVRPERENPESSVDSAKRS